MFIFNRAFQRKARDLWKKFSDEHPHVEKKKLIEAFENFFINKESEGYPSANYYLEYAQILKKKN
jgi:hypothetical protein